MSLAEKLGVNNPGSLADRLGYGEEPDAPEQMGPPDALLQQGAMIQDENDAMTTGERIAVGAGRGVETVGRGALRALGREPEPRDPYGNAAYEDLSDRYPISTAVGEIGGEAGPFVPAGSLVFSAAKTLAPRLLAAAGLGAAEGGTIAAGKEQSVPPAMLLGGAVGFAGEIIGPLLYRYLSSTFREITGRAPRQAPIDEAGNASPEVMAAMEEAGMSVDELVEDVLGLAEQSPRVQELPTVLAQQAQQESMQQGGASSVDDVLAKIRSGDMSDMADVVDPDPTIMDAAERLGLEDSIPASATSRNVTFQETEQALKANPSSQLGARESAFLKQLEERAKETTELMSGTMDRVDFDERVRGDFNQVINGLEELSAPAYREIENIIPPTTASPVDNLNQYIGKLTEDYGGGPDAAEFMSAAEKRMVRILEAENEPTYAALDRVRKDIGKALGEKSGPFKDDTRASLSQLYDVLLQDQRQVAEQFGLADVFDFARRNVQLRKQAEDRMMNLFGKNLDKDVGVQLDRGLDALGRGGIQKLKGMMDDLPVSRRQEAAAMLLNRMLTSGARKEAYLSSGFVGLYERLNRSPAAKKFFFDYLPPEAQQRMDDLYAVSKGIFGAKQFENSSGTTRAALVNADKGGWVKKLYGLARNAVPGGNMAESALLSVLNAPKPRTEVADALLSSREFKDALRSHLTGKKRAESGARLRATDAYKQFIKLQGPGVATRIAAAGFIPWLMTDEEQDDAETR